MRLRKKLGLFYGIALGCTMAAVLLLSMCAEHGLRESARKQQLVAAHVLAQAGQRNIEFQRHRTDAFAQMSIVKDALRAPAGSGPRQRFQAFLSELIITQGRQGIYLFDAQGECIACDDPAEVGRAYSRDVIAQLPVSQRAFAGQASVGASATSLRTGRPILPYAVPISSNGSVGGILWTSVDMEHMNAHMFYSVHVGKKGRGYLAIPQQDHDAHHQLNIADPRDPWTPTPDAVLLALENMDDNTAGCVAAEDGNLLFAATLIPNSSWRVVISSSMEAVLNPIRSLRKIANLILLALLGVLFWVTQKLVYPTIRGIETCSAFAKQIRDGNWVDRLAVAGSDEVSELKRDLNGMVSALSASFEDRIESENKYKALYERAVEGIFQSDLSGNILAMNAAGVRILGATSKDEIIGRNASQFSVNSLDVSDLVKRIMRGGKIDQYEFEIRREDGVIRNCSLSAHLLDESGGEVIQGFLVDITEKYVARQAEKKLHETEALLRDTKMHMARFQLNPHFLFNALNSLNVLITHDPQQANSMVQTLAEFCRATLMVPDDGVSTLKKELELLNQYLAIESVRWSDSLQVECSIEEGVGSVRLSVFSLQLLAENAIKYGQLSGSDPLIIKVNVLRKASDVIIEVINAGRWFDPSEHAKSTGVGLTNLKNRLQTHCGPAARFETEAVDGWVTARICLRQPEGF